MTKVPCERAPDPALAPGRGFAVLGPEMWLKIRITPEFSVHRSGVRVHTDSYTCKRHQSPYTCTDAYTCVLLPYILPSDKILCTCTHGHTDVPICVRWRTQNLRRDRKSELEQLLPRIFHPSPNGMLCSPFTIAFVHVHRTQSQTRECTQLQGASVHVHRTLPVHRERFLPVLRRRVLFSN